MFSYCLMTNHVHLVVQANENVTAIPQLMKHLAGRQTRFGKLGTELFPKSKSLKWFCYLNYHCCCVILRLQSRVF
ncbi:hypothetical protein [Marinobacter oulmenensis]|uniref:hypothetical protein n=1 Tax=Marinobacter oulmenensis TaxID=643747 RepID=UPI003617E47C